MITERLKNETAEHHKATEDVSYGNKIMNGSLTMPEYVTMIAKNYILHALVEKALVESNLIPAELELNERLKTQSLINDLNLLNQPLPTLPSVSINFTSAAEALGAMYVLEGATLGGAYILKALQRNPNFTDLGHFNYYSVYGETIGPKWKTFQAALLNHITTKEQEDIAIASASKTFDLFKDIFVAEHVSAN